MEECKQIIWYNSVDIFNPGGSHYDQFCHRPGFTAFKHLFSYFSLNVSITDRSGAVRLPIKTQVLPELQIPEFQVTTTSYEELGEQRARALLDLARDTGRRLAVMYSGGIDSTLILVNLLKVATAQELRDHCLVLLSEISIRENPRFYQDYVSRCFVCESSYLWHAYVGNPQYIMVTGEGNDQLMGSAVVQKIVLDRGESVALGGVDRDEVIRSLDHTTHDSAISAKITAAFDRIADTAPVPLPTLFHYFWWINFALKWQTTYTRLFCWTAPRFRSTVKFEDNYFSFYHTPEFQLWSMNNTDRMIQGNWRSYKYHCKEIIYKFNHDRDYFDNKAKWGSLARVMFTRDIPRAVTADLTFYDTDYPEDIWDDNNDFI